MPFKKRILSPLAQWLKLDRYSAETRQMLQIHRVTSMCRYYTTTGHQFFGESVISSCLAECTGPHFRAQAFWRFFHMRLKASYHMCIISSKYHKFFMSIKVHFLFVAWWSTCLHNEQYWRPSKAIVKTLPSFQQDKWETRIWLIWLVHHFLFIDINPKLLGLWDCRAADFIC